MAIWKKIKGINNSTRYTKNNKIIKTVDVPPGIIILLKKYNEVDDSEYTISQLDRIAKTCIVCDKPFKYERIVNNRSVALCDEHYYSISIGKVAQYLRMKESLNA